MTCLLIAVIACSIQQLPESINVDVPGREYQEAAFDLRPKYRPPSLMSMQWMLYAAFWCKCEGQLKRCHEILQSIYQQAVELGKLVGIEQNYH